MTRTYISGSGPQARRLAALRVELARFKAVLLDVQGAWQQHFPTT